jgi:acetylornithine deacetylase/succinyl-diaminopimelate desuccinylase-like protein
MRSPEGKILVAGFYDDVIDLTDEERQQIARIPYDEEAYKKLVGVDALYGEPGYTTRERNWARPTLEVNGIWGGFQGEGTKTVLPSLAHAKITCRLVADQRPETIVTALQNHVEKHTPEGVKVQVQRLEGNSDPYLMPADHPGNEAAFEVLQQLYNKAPYYTRSGGTIPVCALFLKHLQAYTVSFGFSLEDEQLHAPNEFVRLSSLERGQKAYALLLKQLARYSPEDFQY